MENLAAGARPRNSSGNRPILPADSLSPTGGFDTPKPVRTSLLTRVAKSLAIPGLFEDGTVPIFWVQRVGFVTFLIAIYLANGHWSNKMLVRTNKLKQEVEDLKVDYQTTKADYMIKSIQSHVAEDVKELNLQESATPPKKVKVKIKS